MPGETIPLAFEGTAALQLIDQLEQRLQRLGQMSGNLPIGGGGGGGYGGAPAGGGGSGGAQSGASAAGGGAGPPSSASSPASASTPGGGGGGGSGWLGSVANVLVSMNNAAAAGIAQQNPMNVESGVLGGINQTSAVRGLINQGMAAGDALSKVPGAAVFGEAIKAKGRAIERETFEPLENAAGRLGSVAGQLGRAGIDIGDRDMGLASEMLIQQEQRAYQNKKRAVQAVYGSGHVMDSFTLAVSHSM